MQRAGFFYVDAQLQLAWLLVIFLAGLLCVNLSVLVDIGLCNILFKAFDCGVIAIVIAGIQLESFVVMT
ncbi:hypothetical protein TDB9533_00621 [Thalassocella blandensis]|nr:hypothetical protein TDB9533_00621 [Thalassocella blandensis]